ncbi:TetR family transcriptional regulator [Virgisporangium aliadipatigenens]|uniref:TetR family transcriptional regulator n=1 Tax=Virgisporangium aliadipatigenens TaxID=741659 RepID=A0A8J3YVW9_9ACTN|nr:TetR/AcrR family transcriptional regulator C-terminal domain-containing protein [Virgisporangium aliadipatigenens]GIJ50678.1 TetR family transcriptional regulator [Virgisporangium aliadipatigenens]
MTNLPVWERPEPPARPTPTPLSRELIVRAAVALADRDGLGAVSLRKVGSALDAGPMRLYGYVASKEELLDLMIDEVYGEVAPEEDPTDGVDWRGSVRRLSLGLRAAARRHEWFVDLLGSRPHLNGPHSLAYLNRTLAAMDAAPGLDDMVAVLTAARTVDAYVVGAIRSEITEARTVRATGTDVEEWQRSAAGHLGRMTADGRFPMLKRMINEPSPELDPEVAFTLGLDCVLDGIAVRLPTTPALRWALDGA